MSGTLNTTTGAQRLTSSEAESLWRNWKERRDSRSRDGLVLAYAPMVRYIASRKVRELPAHCELDDLASSGLVALMEAIDRFDPVKGASFEQYAWTRVAGALVDELRKQDWASRSVRREGRRIERARDSFFARVGTMPTEVELAKELGTTVDELRLSVDDIDRSDIASLNAPSRSAEDSLPTEVGETIQAPEGECDPEPSLLSADRNAAVRAGIARLSDRERHVLSLVHVQELPGAEIGRMLGVSESRVSQILAGIRRKLKDQLDSYETAAAAA
jgi:RNA polymerase sigma factor FliA